MIGFFTVRQMRNDFDDDIRRRTPRVIQDRVAIRSTVGGYRIEGRENLVELAFPRLTT